MSAGRRHRTLCPKLQVENRAPAIVQALKRGLVSLDELR
jgi:hypothetical protein